jgi:hypothetical protein
MFYGKDSFIQQCRLGNHSKSNAIGQFEIEIISLKACSILKTVFVCNAAMLIVGK